MDLKKLRYFIAVAEELQTSTSITRHSMEY